MSLKAMLNRLRPPKKEEPPKIPPEWIGEAPAPVEAVEPVAAPVWPPMPKMGSLKINPRRYFMWVAKALFFVYLLLSVGAAWRYPVVLIIFVPTILVILDYIRIDKIMRQAAGWWKPKEKDEHSNTAGAE